MGIHRKLDRVLVNDNFVDEFPFSSSCFLARGVSDHSPVVVSLAYGRPSGRTPFRFDNFITSLPDFHMLVDQAWQSPIVGTYAFRLLAKLKSLKRSLRGLRSRVGAVSQKVKISRDSLQHVQMLVDSNPRDLSLQERLASVSQDFQFALKMEDSYLRQRAKIRWIKEGDLNTAFFHKAVKERRNRSLIASILDGHGTEVHGEAVVNAFVDHFKSILGERDVNVVPDIPEDFFANRLSIDDANFMIRPITKDEVKRAMFDIADDRAPGSDGYSSKFFKAAWHIVGPDVELAVQDFFYRGRLARELNHTSICLLPKHEHASRVTDYRPISLCNVIYKCIAKIISWRIRDSLDFLVSMNQSAFIPGRRITDNILMAHEIMDGYGKRGGPPRCSFKIDIQKAYDSVDWQFLCTVLDRLGFHPIMRHWIMELVSTTSFSVVVNGTSHGFFKGGRGLRQGCPLSPYLFTLVMEVFSSLFRRRLLYDRRFLLHKGCERLSITHLCFADDLMVFSRGDVESVRVLKEILDEFAILSGLKPSMPKSAVYFSNVDLATTNAIRGVLPFQVGNLPFRYLGVPLSSKRLVVSDFAPLVAQVGTRVLNWKSKFLSFGGRLQLIRSVLESLQLYWMTVFMLPSSVSQSIERMFRAFLWSQSENSQGKAKVAWDQVCRPKKYGGLGIKRLPVWNRALLSTHVWDILRRKNSLWVTWLYAHRLHISSFWVVQSSSNSSWVWRKLLDLREQLRPHFYSSIGDGKSTNAWEDNWILGRPISAWLPYRLFSAEGFNKMHTVFHVISALGNAWPSTWQARNHNLPSTIVPVLSMQNRDQVQWMNSRHEPRRFSVSEVWRSFIGIQEEVPWFNICWFKGHIPKHSFCFWLALLDRLPTQQRLAAWNLNDGSLPCPLCNDIMDSRDHLFFQCTYSMAVWDRLKDLMTARVMTLLHRQWHPGETRKKCIFVGAVYVIWNERNRRLFANSSMDPDVLFRELLRFVDLRGGLGDCSSFAGQTSTWSVTSTTSFPKKKDNISKS
ncbi:hypothetical protein OSB04_031863 [Centaurea solstitialis]|uniref:Reverse transcriptase domain-containing protein n=1 Tax=Centaurea solstitialis TaxID=347529 RepID=A0AA38SAD2_9ASTR|nr:hypothetical protein OSB04_031863 [Centaurea solstitialis]